MSFKTTNLPIIGGIIAAIGAGLCCVGPLVLLLLGISGAWIANLTKLTPYTPYFAAGVLVLFGYAGWQVHRPVEHCSPGTACATAPVRRRRQIIFWLAAVLATIFVTSKYWIIWLV